MNHHLDQTNLTILKYLSEGYTLKETSDKIYLSRGAVKKRLEKMRDETGCKNITGLIFHYSDQIKQLKQAS